MKHFLLFCCAVIFWTHASYTQIVFTAGAVTCNPAGALCVGSNCVSPGLVSDGDPLTAGTMNTAIGVACTNTLIADFAAVQASGRWGGFYVSGSNLLTLAGSITVTLRNTVTTQSQTASGAGLLSLLANGNGFLQLQSTIPFNRIELTLGGIASVIQTINIFTGFSSNVAQALPLAVTWLSFSATERNGKVILDWSTASEENSDYFSIERSVDGISYSAIGTIKAAGTTSARSDYSFTDNVPVARAINYYRIRQADFDRRFTYSITRYADVGGDGKMIRITPNPAASSITVNGNLNRTRLKIYDTYGKEVLIRNLSGSQNKVDINSLMTGIYLLIIDDNERVIDQQKLIISR